MTKKNEQTVAHAPEHVVELPHDAIRVEYVALSTVVLWDRNPKRHDIGAIVQSIAEHGFRDPPAYDATLGALVEGNGRAEALQWMIVQGYTIPRGIGQILDATTREVVDWAVPVAFGVDALSRIAAERYGIDHNNLVLSGGDFTAADYARLWDHSYVDVLRDLAEHEQLPVSVSGADVDQLIQLATNGEGSGLQFDYSVGAGGGFSEGEQFAARSAYQAIIGLSDEQTRDAQLKGDLQAFCERWGLTSKIVKR